MRQSGAFRLQHEDLRTGVKNRLRESFNLSGFGNLLLLFSLLLAGVLGNLLSLSMFFGVDIIFGSIATMIIARRFGPLVGGLGGFVISLYTLLLWGHPYALIIFTLEGVFVGLFSQRKQAGTVVRASVVYWVLVGMPLAWAFYSGPLGLPTEAVQLILFKQGFNGIGNTIIAMVLYEFGVRNLERRGIDTAGNDGMLNSSELLTIVASLAVLLPAVLVISMVGRGTLTAALRQSEAQLDLTVNRAVAELQQELRIYAQSSRSEASRLLAGDLPAEELDALVDEYHSRRKFAGLYIYRDGRLVYNRMREGLSPVAASRMPDFAELDAGADFGRIYAVTDGSDSYFGASVRVDGGVTLTLIQVGAMIDGDTFGEGTRHVAELYSRSGELLLTYDFDGVLGRQAVPIEVGGGEVTALVPDDPRLSAVARWLGTYLVANVTLGEWRDGSMQLQMATSIAGSIDRAQRSHVGIVLVGLLVILVVVILSPLLTRIITRPLEQMVAAARQLSRDIHAQVDWPSAPIVELEEFKNQFVIAVERMKAGLRETEALIEGSNAPIFGTDTEGRINVWNRSMAALTGVSPEQAMQRDLVAEFVVEGMQDQLGTSIADAMKGVDMEPFEVAMRCPDDRVVTLLMNWTPRHDVDRRLSGVVGIAQDIQARKEHEALVARTARLVTLGEMSTSVAHEINQPLNIIRLAASNIRRRALAGKLEEEFLLAKLERIGDQVVRAAGIIDHMRIFGRARTAEVTRFDPREVLTSALRLVGEQHRMVGLTSTCEFAAGQFGVQGNPVEFEQVILELLANVRDAYAGQPGPVSLRVERGEGEHVRVIVADRAGGIPESTMSRIYEPFFTTKGIGQGTGLGLSVCYGIITEMGGSIAASNQDGGATFVLTLPVVEPVIQSS